MNLRQKKVNIYEVPPVRTGALNSQLGFFLVPATPPYPTAHFLHNILLPGFQDIKQGLDETTGRLLENLLICGIYPLPPNNSQKLLWTLQWA